MDLVALVQVSSILGYKSVFQAVREPWERVYSETSLVSWRRGRRGQLRALRLAMSMFCWKAVGICLPLVPFAYLPRVQNT